eukprot:6479188-Amphidinium_carterae.1
MAVDCSGNHDFTLAMLFALPVVARSLCWVSGTEPNVPAYENLPQNAFPCANGSGKPHGKHLKQQTKV